MNAYARTWKSVSEPTLVTCVEPIWIWNDASIWTSALAAQTWTTAELRGRDGYRRFLCWSLRWSFFRRGSFLRTPPLHRRDRSSDGLDRTVLGLLRLLEPFLACTTCDFHSRFVSRRTPPKGAESWQRNWLRASS